VHEDKPRSVSSDFSSMLQQRPLARFCLVYLAGVAAYIIPSQGTADPVLLLRIGAMALATAILIILVPLARRGGRLTPDSLQSWLRGPVVIAAVFLLAASAAAWQSAIPSSDVSRLASVHLITLEGEAASEPHRSPNGTSVNIRCFSAATGRTRYRVTGAVQIWQPRPLFRSRSPRPHLRWPEPGESVGVTGVLSGLDPQSRPFEAGLLHSRIYSVIQIGKGGGLFVQPGQRETLQVFCLRARDALMAGLQSLPDRERQTLAGMLFHEKSGIDPGILDDLQRTGTIHIVATAGLHVGIFLGTCLMILSFALPRRGAVVISMTLLPAYAVACGGWPAVTRATTLAELFLLAWLLGRLSDAATCLCLVAAGMAALNPFSILDPGFQFTFLTVGVILLTLPLLSAFERERGTKSWFRRGARHLAEISALSFAAQAASWPLTVYYFGVVSFVGVFANLLIVPLLMIILPLALAASLCWHVSAALAVIPLTLLDHLLDLLLGTAHILARVPFACLTLGPISWPPVAIYYLVLLLLAGWVRLRQARGEHGRGVSEAGESGQIGQ